MELFITTPNLPQNDISLALVDGRIPRDMEENLLRRNIRLIKTEKIRDLNPAIAYHPDMMLHHIGGNDIVVSPQMSENIIYKLENEGFNIIFGKRILKEEYPSDIAYNTARVGNIAVCNIDNTDKEIIYNLYKNKVDIIDVKQGYAKCSICVVDKDAIITSDEGVYKKLRGKIDILLISKGDIDLFTMNYGFIGGTTGYISKNEMCFFGNVNKHTNYNSIFKFLLKYEKKIINLSQNKLVDLGTLIPLKEYSILS